MLGNINIIIADSNFLSRKGLAVLLEENADFTLLAEVVSHEELIEQSIYHKPALIIIDYTSANFSVEGLQQISNKYPKAKILAITELQSNEVIAKGFKMGINSYLLKECEQDEIVEAIYKTVQGEKFMCGKIANAIVNDKSLLADSNEYSCKGMKISVREMEIITLIAEGYSNKEVADKLFLSTHTVTTHRKNIMNKLGVNNTAGLVLFAVRENLVSPNHFLFSSNN